jgi:hypothetical protein
MNSLNVTLAIIWAEKNNIFFFLIVQVVLHIVKVF